jgi:hypothetical protein
MKISLFSRLVLVSVMVNLFVLTSHAQIEFGLKGGLNVSELLADRYESVSIGGNPQYIRNFPRKTLNAGVVVSIPLSKKLSLQPEAVFSEQGANGKPSSQYLISANEQYQFNFLNFPVLLKYSWPAGFFAETGPQIGYLINAQIAETVVGASATSYYNVKSQYKSVDLGWALGVGYLSPINLGFNVRYTLGLSNFSNIDPNGAQQNAPVQNGSLKNSVVQIGLFYLFGKDRTQVEP